MDKIQARAPPAHELVRAWNTFFAYKAAKREAVNNIQAQHALRTFKHLQQNDLREGEIMDGAEGYQLGVEDLRTAMATLAVMPNDKTDTHNELAKVLHSEIKRRTVGQPDEDSHVDVKYFVTVLTQTGDSTQARVITEEFWQKDREILERSRNTQKSGRKLWHLVMAGFARENNETELLRTVKMAEERGVMYHHPMQEIMTTFYASRDDVEATRRWYNRPLAGSSFPTPETVALVLRFCIRNDELEWCKTVFRELLERNPTKAIWDIVFQWAAGALGKGVEDVERMMEVMIRRNQNDETMRPDVETINGLVDLAMSLNEPYLAERYITLGLKSGIRPNAKTFILQMNYRVDAGDLTGAQAAYEGLQSEEITNNEDLLAINKYVRALCSAKSPNYDLITSITSDLEERHARLEADTVSALCMMHLSRQELHDVVDILQSHTFHYTLEERARIRDAFLAYCLDRKNNNSRAWDAYTIFRQIFEETEIDIRTKMMNEFFQRRRSDMACHVFGHMRQHIRKERRPMLDTYIQCFEGIAQCADRESLDMVHNMLKMDSSIEPNTRLYNALMMAYTACEDSDRALDFWDDITNSREGPSYRSLEIVFRACQRKPFGDRMAREIWGKIRRMEIEVTQEVFVAFVGALAGQGKLEEAKGMVDGMEKDLGFTVDVFTYVSLCIPSIIHCPWLSTVLIVRIGSEHSITPSQGKIAKTS